MAERLTLPVLPLREVVLFPGVTAPIGAGRPATLRAIEAALATPERLVFAVSQRQNVESVTSDVLYTIGTIARIGQLQRGLSGMQLLLHGEQRGIAIHYTEQGGLSPGHRARGRGDAAAQRRGSGLRRRCTARPGPGRPSWARSPACRTRWSSRCWPA